MTRHKGRHPITETSTVYYDICTVKHEFDRYGSHRITVVTPTGSHSGIWASYGRPAFLTTRESWGLSVVKFCATTEYFEGELDEIFVMHTLKEHELWENGDEDEEATETEPSKETVQETETEDPAPTERSLTLAEKAALRRKQKESGDGR